MLRKISLGDKGVKNMKFKARLMTQQEVDRVLVRLAHQIVEKNHGTE